MNERVSRWPAIVLVAGWLGLGSMATAQTTLPELARYRPTEQERTAIQAEIDGLAGALAALPRDDVHDRDALADVAVFHKAAVWALRLGEFTAQGDVATTLNVLARGRERARQWAGGKRPWEEARGSVVRGFDSKVDGSVQPYSVVVPVDIPQAAGKVRLDVVLHGRDMALNEVRFIAAHDGTSAPDDAHEALTLHVFGRGNNGYRWAGEVDVFEAIDAVRRNYPVDDQRVVLRGFSMGGAGAWHLGLHHPSRWSSVEAGAGFTDAKSFAQLDQGPAVQEKMLHIYNPVDHALNVADVAVASYAGENDPQAQAGRTIEDALKSLGFAMRTEGLVTRGERIDFLRVVGAGMGHAIDPSSAKVLKAFHDEHSRAGTSLNPRRVRFATYTLKYNQAAWLAIMELREQNRRSVVDAEVEGNRVIVRTTENVVALGVERHMGESIRFGEKEFPLEGAVKGLLPNVYFRHAGGEWSQLDYNASRALEENAERIKHPNVQGPIDDAFTGSFLCVRGTGAPWNPDVQRWADARLTGFADDWRRWLRGEVRVKDDTDVTVADIEKHHLILFGDPGSNRLLAQLLKGLPLDWSRTEIRLGGRYGSADHAPALIAPNPLNARRYVVLNSGHTFGAAEFNGTSALLYPRLGDYAVFKVDESGGQLKVTGFFDERWRDKPPLSVAPKN